MISIRSDISEKLSIPWGEGLIGKMIVFLPQNDEAGIIKKSYRQ